MPRIRLFLFALFLPTLASAGLVRIDGADGPAVHPTASAELHHSSSAGYLSLRARHAAEDAVAFGGRASGIFAGGALELGRGAAATPVYAASDIRFLPFADASFDAVLNVFTSLGLFLSDDEDLVALREARRVLRPGGALLLESMHRDDVIASYAERDRWSLPDGTEIRVRRRFDPVTGISRERLQWRRGDESGRKAHALRLRTATEIDRLLLAAGFGPIRYYGDWDGSALHHTSESVIAVAISAS